MTTIFISSGFSWTFFGIIAGVTIFAFLFFCLCNYMEDKAGSELGAMLVAFGIGMLIGSIAFHIFAVVNDIYYRSDTQVIDTHLSEHYGVEKVTGESGVGVDPTTVSENTWHADSIVIGGTTHKDCTLTVTNPHKDGGYVADATLTCADPSGGGQVAIQPKK